MNENLSGGVSSYNKMHVDAAFKLGREEKKRAEE